MSETLEQMRARLREQEAWGKWNTAPLANRIARAEDERRPPWLRMARRWGITAAVVSFSLLYWIAILVPIWRALR